MEQLERRARAAPADLQAALALAHAHLARARHDGNPRSLGYAEAAWHRLRSRRRPSCSVLAATIHQSRLSSAQALAELDAALGLLPTTRKPAHARLNPHRARPARRRKARLRGARTRHAGPGGKWVSGRAGPGRRARRRTRRRSPMRAARGRGLALLSLRGGCLLAGPSRAGRACARAGAGLDAEDRSRRACTRTSCSTCRAAQGVPSSCAAAPGRRAVLAPSARGAATHAADAASSCAQSSAFT